MPGKEPVVIISLAEWNAIKETEHLPSNPANAAHLRRSVAQANSGQVQPHESSKTDRAGPAAGCGLEFRLAGRRGGTCRRAYLERF